jgi:hypothetical protein
MVSYLYFFIILILNILIYKSLTYLGKNSKNNTNFEWPKRVFPLSDDEYECLSLRLDKNNNKLSSKYKCSKKDGKRVSHENGRNSSLLLASSSSDSNPNLNKQIDPILIVES